MQTARYSKTECGRQFLDAANSKFRHELIWTEPIVADLIRWLAARPRTFGEAHSLGIAEGSTWDAALIDGTLIIEGYNGDDVVDGIVRPHADARLLISPKGYAERNALSQVEVDVPLAA